MIDQYDVIVVGAGPGGSVAAIVAAQHGLRTLLVDRETLPRDKACGDAVPEPAFVLMRQLGITDPFTDTSFEIDFVKIVGSAGQHLALKVFPQMGEKSRIMPRFTFDHVLFQHAINCGAEFKMLNVTEPLVDKGQVIGIRAKTGSTTQEFHSKLVIAADGATSVIARGLHVPRHADQHLSISVRGYVDTREAMEPVIELDFLRTLTPGYGWIFPVSKHCANVGVGLRLDIYKRQQKPLAEYLQAYLDTPHLRRLVGDNKVENIKSWQLPNCSVEEKRVFDGAILIGDAGGFVNPLTGAGIYPAMATAKYAAEVGIKAIQTGDLSERGLQEFESLWRRELQQGMRASAFVQRTIARAPICVDAAILIGQVFPSTMRQLISKI